MVYLFFRDAKILKSLQAGSKVVVMYFKTTCQSVITLIIIRHVTKDSKNFLPSRIECASLNWIIAKYERMKFDTGRNRINLIKMYEIALFN